WADGINDRRHKVTARSSYEFSKLFTLSGIADFQTGTPINRIASFRDLDGSGSVFGNGFVGNYDRFYGVARNAERLPSSLQLGVSARFRVPLGQRGLDLRTDVFNLLNSTVVSGFANGIPGGGPRTQVGRPGDPVVYSAAAPPRQIQLSAQFAF
ncbi:MAG: TonB-dependent receptor, partial [Gemmatimonadales bacterium]